MNISKPSIPKGTRDFSPEEMLRRKYIFNSIESTFRLFGYQPLETPSMEYLSTLLGKYGDEGDKLLFRILNSGDFLSEVKSNDTYSSSQKLSTYISEKGLRYDLTVPFARYVVMHQNEINFPFKRYQLQPVWRADRPQKGRYREFYQCDADVIGSDSLLNEVELIQIIDKIFSKLNVNVIIKVNNRKILQGISDYIGETEKISDITIAIDKLDKTGIADVNEELASKGISSEAIEKLKPVIMLKGSNEEKMKKLEVLLSNSESGKLGLVEMNTIFNYLPGLSVKSPVELDLTLARGLNYYTGAIIEVKAVDINIGSVCGGGRYDNLTGIFGLPGISGVGISFGADRIYDVLSELNLFPDMITANSRVLFVNFGEKEELYCLNIVNSLRNEGIAAELFPDRGKMKKQMAYADRKQIPYVVLVGETEMNENLLSVKNMSTGEQSRMTPDGLVSIIRQI